MREIMSTPSIARLLAGAALIAILPVAAQAQTTPTAPETTGTSAATPDAGPIFSAW